MWNLTGNYYLKSRFFGGYTIMVELQDMTGENSNIWRRGEKHHIVQVLKTKVL